MLSAVSPARIVVDEHLDEEPASVSNDRDTVESESEVAVDLETLPTPAREQFVHPPAELEQAVFERPLARHQSDTDMVILVDARRIVERDETKARRGVELRRCGQASSAT